MRNTFHNEHRPERTTPTAATQRPGKPHGPADTDTQAPEWTTEHWKHCVEAEARNRLKHEVHDVGALRR